MRDVSRRPGQGRAILLAGVALATILAGCRHDAPPPPAERSFEWTTYSNEAIGYTMSIPDVYRIDEEGGGEAVFFRWDGRVPVKVELTDERNGRRNGLWPGEEPSGEIELDGRPGDLYEYDHWDGPFGSAMRSYVVPHDGKELGLEFRSDGELHAVNQQILDSFKFEE
jgi:hypothetical protein